MQQKHTRASAPRILAVLAFALAAVLGSAQGATALGWSTVVNCAGGGQLSGRSYQVTFSNAGGNTYADLGCGSNVSIQLYYQVYPGGPYAKTTMKLVQGTQVSQVQSGTWNGYHKAYNGSGVQIGSVNS